MKDKKPMKCARLAWAAAFVMCVSISPALAEHGALTTTVRDGWIDRAVQNLVSAGLAGPLSKPAGEMTNLEVAQLTARSARKYLAQAPPSPEEGRTTAMPDGAAQSLGRLAAEFKTELSAMDLDVARLEERIDEQERRNRRFASLQKEFLKRTGTELAGYSRAYFDTYRGFGPDAVYGPMDYNDILFGDIRLKSVPVPFVLFNADIRLTRTIGLVYAEPIHPDFNLRWISLTNTNDVANITAGDFYRSYTPLTLWNNEIPVYTMVEPTSYRRVRKDVEELVYMDHGPDWHLRGFEAASDQDLAGGLPLSSFHLQAMTGEMQSATPVNFSNYYAGSEAAMDFFGDQLEIKGAGLLLWDDNADSAVPYVPNLSSTFARQYRVGSLSASFHLPLDASVSLEGSAEYAGSYYRDNAYDPQSSLSDSALLARMEVGYGGMHLTAKYVDNGAHFYSPGAQTNRYTAAVGVAGTDGYLNGSRNLDDGLGGYLDNYVFQGLNRPSLAVYDRMGENILPYGDATPDREGFVLGFSAEFGRKGWLKPQLSYAPSMREIQPDSVGATVVGSSTTRTFTGYEGALTVDLAKVLEGAPKTCDVALDYKYQSTDLGMGGPPFEVGTFIAAADAGPFPGVPLFDGLVLSAAFEQARSTGSEYTLTNQSLPTLANYVSYYDPSAVGQYAYQALDVTRTSWAFGFKLPVSSNFTIHGDWFYNQYTWSDQPGFDRREQIWRLTDEVSF